MLWLYAYVYLVIRTSRNKLFSHLNMTIDIVADFVESVVSESPTHEVGNGNIIANRIV